MHDAKRDEVAPTPIQHIGPVSSEVLNEDTSENLHVLMQTSMLTESAASYSQRAQASPSRRS